MRKKLALILALLLVLAVAAGCASSKSEDRATPQAAPAPAVDYESAKGGSGEAGSSDGGGLDTNAVTTEEAQNYGGRKIIRTFQYNITSPQFDADLAAILASATAVGGWVQNSTVQGTPPETYTDRGREAYISVAIPSDKVDGFVAGLEQIGEVTYRNTTTDDVSDQYMDLESRIAVLRVQLERLKSLLTESAKLDDILALETEIARVTLEIERLTTDLNALASLVDYSTVTISLTEERIAAGPASQKDTGTRIREGFASVLNGVGVFLENLFVFLIVASPVWLPLAVIVVVVLLLVRRKNRRLAAAKAAKTNQESGSEGTS